MATQVGIGKTTKKISSEAAQEAARMALENLEGKKPNFAILYGTIGYDQREFLNTVRKEIGPIPLVGGTFEGLISQDFSNETRYAGLIALIHSDKLKMKAFKATGNPVNGEGFATELLQNIQSEIGSEGLNHAKAFIFFLDVIRADFISFLNSINARLPETLVKLGIGTFDDFQLKSSYQYFNDEVLTQSVVAALWDGDIEVEMVTCHGCVPLGVEFEVTRAEKNKLMELNKRGAVSVVEEYVAEGEQKSDELIPTDVSHLIMAKELSQGVAKSFGDPYITLHPIVIERKTKSLFLSTNINTGNRVCFMRRDPENTTGNLRKNAKKLVARKPNQKPVMVIDCNCTARGRIFYGEEAYSKGTLPAQEVIGRDVPWLGSFCFGEIAPVGDELISQGYAEILLAVYENSK